MKKTIVLLLLCLASVNYLSAQSPTSAEILDDIYNSLSNSKGVKTDSVQYTGSDFKKAGGFEWMRGSGSGWTKGCRLTVADAKEKLAGRIRDGFKSLSSETQSVNLSQTNSAATYFDDTRTVYMYRYEPDSRTLYFLKAKTEGEICVPYGWTRLNYMDATVHNSVSARNPLAQADETSLRLLGLSRLWAEARRNFVFMDRVRVNWDSVYVANIPAIIQAEDRNECFFILQRMAAQLGDGHTYVYGNLEDRKYTPLKTVMIDGRVYVDQVLSTVLHDKGLRRGMELVYVNGEPAIDYGKSRIAPYVSSSTPQWTEHETFDGFNLLKGKTGDTLRLVFSLNDKTLSIPYVLGSAPQDISPDNRTLSFEIKKNRIGYLRITNFMDSAIKEEFDRLYPGLLKTQALIIDIRNNAGGNSGNADYIIRHLCNDTIKTGIWRSPMYIPAFASWNMEQPWYNAESGKMFPVRDKEIYSGEVVVLVDKGTFSAAEDFCSLFATAKRGKIIGSKTGGSTGNGVRVELIPCHTYANICSKHDAMPDGTEFVGIGIQPDIEVAQTYSSYFNDSEDAVLKAAMNYLQTALKNQ